MSPTAAVCRHMCCARGLTLLGAHAYRMLIGAGNPMLCPIFHVIHMQYTCHNRLQECVAIWGPGGCPDLNGVAPDLVRPPMEEALPAAGKRVRAVAPGFEHSQVTVLFVFWCFVFFSFCVFPSLVCFLGAAGGSCAKKRIGSLAVPAPILPR